MLAHQVLKKRKNAPATCSHARVPPFGTDARLLTDDFVGLFLSMLPTRGGGSSGHDGAAVAFTGLSRDPSREKSMDMSFSKSLFNAFDISAFAEFIRKRLC